jgi:DNA-binding Xre family transcriptional regulator
MSKKDYTKKLLSLMQKAGVANLKTLIKVSGVSERQILRLRRGEIELIRLDTLLSLSQSLKISLNQLISSFSQIKIDIETVNSKEDLLQRITHLEKEYERSLSQLAEQKNILKQEFQQQSLQLLESLILQFPTAAQKARENPELEAVKILPLVEKPLEKLLQTWGIETIAAVGAEIPYSEQYHQLMESGALPGEMVRVRYPGYRQGNKLLYRAKVSKI